MADVSRQRGDREWQQGRGGGGCGRYALVSTVSPATSFVLVSRANLTNTPACVMDLCRPSVTSRYSLLFLARWPPHPLPPDLVSPIPQSFRNFGSAAGDESRDILPFSSLRFEMRDWAHIVAILGIYASQKDIWRIVSKRYRSVGNTRKGNIESRVSSRVTDVSAQTVNCEI